ncbi:MAG TPA: alkaline phosphatase D family protein [Verrucomicrobiae bacterium]|nr:alkaline phosphatase D family protein [Verrucomicrobiae bacterium]
MTHPLYRILNSPRVNRRSFIFATSSLAAAAFWSAHAFGAITKTPAFSDYPFQLGVASGDPASDGFVLWTRLAPRPLEGGGMASEPVEVAWQIAEDEAMTKTVKKGTTVATPDWAHSVHVEVDGLRPDRWYWYQFKAGNEVSPKGRTRTLPTLNTGPDRLRIAFASCQHYEAGFYTAYHHMAGEDVDLIFHLGDYIYEGAASSKGIRRHNSKEIFTLEDYRNRYGLYKSDRALQAAHAMAPWMVTWDDHEVDNNYASATPEEKSVNRVPFLQRRAAAYKAYYEHMPLRRTSLPQGPDMDLYRRLSFGRLAEFFVLDTRQYRTDQPCGDHVQGDCADAMNPRATIMGEAQRQWLFSGLEKSDAKWNVLAQQVMMARADLKAGPEVGFSMDQWPGYEMDRRRVLKHFAERPISNPIVMTGDIHSNWANELIMDFDQLDSKTVATEFVGTSISSGGDGAHHSKKIEQLLSENPFVKFHNAERGYVRCEITPQLWRSDYRTVPYVTRLDAPVMTRASFVVESGDPKLHVG